MQEEPSGEREVFFEDGFQLGPGFEAVQGDRALECFCKFEVLGEDLCLIGEIGVGHPTIEAGFADAGGWMKRQTFEQVLGPVGGALGEPPRMESEGREGAFDFACERIDGVPVAFPSGIEDPAVNSGSSGLSEAAGSGGGESRVLEVTVSVEEAHSFCLGEVASGFD